MHTTNNVFSPTDIELQTGAGQILVTLQSEAPIFVLGRNGTGKSALVHRIRASLGERGIYIPGSRPSYFDGDSLNMTPAQRFAYEQNKLGWDASPDIRVRPVSGTMRNEKALFDLQASINQFNADLAAKFAASGGALVQSEIGVPPLDRTNRLIAQANLPVQIVMSDGQLKAVRNGAPYSISKMSDGERNALILIAEVVCARSNSILVIDEPELHLHRAIIIPLLAAIFSERADCGFLVSTHELAIPGEFPKAKIVLTRGCEWVGPTVQHWDLSVIESPAALPEEVRIDILGARKKILFAEGTGSSLDQPLYALLFPAISVISKKTCTEVRRATVGVNSVHSLHNAEAFGVVDNDGMPDAFVTKLESESVYALPMFSVESLYLSLPVRRAVAKRQAMTFGREEEEFGKAADAAGLSSIQTNNQCEYLAARVAERQMRDQVSENMPSREDIINAGGSKLSIEITHAYEDVLERLKAHISAGDIDSVIWGFPIRDSGLPKAVSHAFGFASVERYYEAVKALIASDNSLRSELRTLFGKLGSNLS